MKKIAMLALVSVIMTSTAAISQAAGPPEERIKSAYKMLLQETDTNKDGKLAVSECQAIYKDPVTADKNCNFWDANHNGVITEDEYVAQAMSIGKK